MRAATVPSRSRAGLLFLFAAVVPLLPRPTWGGTAVLLTAGAVAVLLFGLVVAHLHTPLDPGTARAAVAVVLLILVLSSAHGMKILLAQEWSEVSYLLARLLALVVSVAVFLWVRAGAIPVPRVAGAFLVGYLVLSLLMLLIALTHADLFEPVRPSRWYVAGFGLGKTTGVPRSFGELSILAGIAWAFLLVYRRWMRRDLWLVAAAMVLVSVMVAQSRTGLAAWLAVTASFLVLRVATAAWVGRGLVVAAAAVPLMADLVLNALRGNEAAAYVVGENTFEDNVHIRLELNALAVHLLVRSGLPQAVLGVGRSRWTHASADAVGAETVVHNHVLAALVFSGVLLGAAFLLVCYLVPLWRTAASAGSRPDSLFLLLSGLGMLVSLQFYAGFFSLSVSLLVGLLWASTLPVGKCTDRQPAIGQVPTPIPGSMGANP